MNLSSKKPVSNKLMQQIYLEAAQREVQRRKSENFPDFHTWLPTVTPTWNWDFPHLVYIQKYLQQIVNGDLKKLMIFVPRQYGKSEQGTIRFPAYMLERNPEKKILIASYGADLAESFSRKMRSIVRSRGIVPLNNERTAVSNWTTRSGGLVKAAGVGGPIVGFGFNLFVMDDVIKGRVEADSKSIRETTWKWYTDDLKGCAAKDAQYVFCCTRWCEDDLPARILNVENDWKVINLPALCEGNDPEDYPIKRKLDDPLCPELHPLKQVLEFKRTMGQSFYAIMQGHPSPLEGDIWKKQWFCEDGDITKPIHTVAKFPNRAKLTQMYDTAMEKGQRNDFSAMVEGCMVDGIIFVCARENAQLDFPELIKVMKSNRLRAYRNDTPPDVCTEGTAQGKPTRQQLRLEGIPVIEINVGTTDKEVKAKSVTSYAESNMIVFVNEDGNLNADLIAQLMGFPHAKHDDLHDAFVLLIRRLTTAKQGWSKDIMRRIAQRIS